MAADSLGELEALHRDLEALKENRMPNIDRLAAELEAHVDEFRNLLEQKKRSSESRRKLCSGRFYPLPSARPPVLSAF